jgi:hypothetical protein
MIGARLGVIALSGGGVNPTSYQLGTLLKLALHLIQLFYHYKQVLLHIRELLIGVMVQLHRQVTQTELTSTQLLELRQSQFLVKLKVGDKLVLVTI